MLTVAGLIKLLSYLPRNAIVRTEGCDCTGWATNVYLAKSQKSVLIGRENGVGSCPGFDNKEEYISNEDEDAYWERVGI